MSGAIDPTIEPAVDPGVGPAVDPAVDVERSPGEHGVGGPAGEAHTAELRDETAEAVHRHLVVAVDGPAGSGKSSVSRASASALGFAYQDTGAAYRAFALHALDSGVDLDDAEAIIGVLPSFRYDITIDPARASSVTVDGRDVTDEIRTRGSPPP